ncbi:AAA family ATPase [Desulfonema magnum]|uniref:Cytidylate kinase-like family protein n=1 Tax=Desulfonema magnum TaxID=45655 RepID=A0A975BID1_9BACT|nr:cytidylate kinase-like family protein [Desulfonema magnum]QTA86239.1 Cytidylate kinase-like family protein [Desulfonema magnum]
MSVITISRQFGAGGRTLGTLVAEKLGYSLVDEDIIEKVAQKARVSPNWVKSVEKEAGGRLLKYISGLGPFRKNYLERIGEHKRGYIDGHIYVDLLHEIIKELAHEGDCVIIGRGGQYILKDYEDVWHVLLIADLDHRVKFMEEHYELSSRQAALIVDKHGKRRKNLYRYFHKEDYDQPYLYHIVLNMGRLTIEKAANQVCKLTEDD